MQVSVEVTDGLQRRMTVGIPKEQVDKEYQTRLQSLARKTKINGFRPGKAPLRIIQQHYGEQLRQEAIEEILRHSIPEVLEQQNLHIIGQPMLESVDDKGDNVDYLTYCLKFEVYPEVGTVTFEGISINMPRVDIVEEDIEDMLLSLRRQRQSWNSVERPAQLNDRINLDYHGTLNGEDFAGNQASRKDIIIGQGMYIKAFEDALIGLLPNSEAEFDVIFPENYQQQDLAGQTVHFKVVVYTVEEPQLPEMDNDLAMTFGVEEGGVEALRTEILDNLCRERDKEIKNQVKKELFEHLAARNDILIPNAMINDEAERMARNFQRELQSQGLRFTQMLDPKKFTNAAIPRVKMGILLREIIQAQGFQPDPLKVRQLIESMAASYEDPDTYIAWHYSNPEHLADAEAAVLEDMVLEWALGHIQVIEIPMSFKELIAKRQQAQAA
jgi:trigger factor